VASVSLSDVLEMPLPERLRLAQAIWDSIAEKPDALPVTEAERQELDLRLAAFERDPGAGRSWEEVKAKLQGRK